MTILCLYWFKEKKKISWKICIIIIISLGLQAPRNC